MQAAKVKYNCTNCGGHYPKWSGQCIGCGAWNTLAETVSIANAGVAGVAPPDVAALVNLSDVQLTQEARVASGLPELDLVLGGGLVNSAVILLGGDPGIGKSTLLLQVLGYLSRQHKVIYVSGEESLTQIAVRAQRLNLQSLPLLLLAATNLDQILAVLLEHKPQFLVIDSIQTMYTSSSNGSPGSVNQVRDCAAYLVNFAKQHQCTLFLVSHVTKEGVVAGPRVLEHVVDTVLYFETTNDSKYRVVRAIKNRFGAVNELGIFAMTGTGLKPVNNPSAIFLAGHHQASSGTVITATKEGSRPLLLEIQALVSASPVPAPKRLSLGWDTQRLLMLLAILHRHARIKSYDRDVFINVVGGMQLNDPAADLPVVLAVVSSLYNVPLPPKMVVFGEIGLAGELRPVAGGQERLSAAKKHGLDIAIIPQANMPKTKPNDLTIYQAPSLAAVLAILAQLLGFPYSS